MSNNVWDDTETLNLGEGTPKVDDGDHTLEVREARVQQSRNPRTMGQVYFILEGKVLESTEHNPGETRSISINISGFGKPDAKALVAAALGKAFEEVTKSDMERSTGPDQILRGRTLRIKAYQKPTKSGNSFQKVVALELKRASRQASAQPAAPPPPPPPEAAPDRVVDAAGVTWYKHPGVPGSYYDANRNIKALVDIRR